MFDELHDPDPPTPVSRHLAAVVGRARWLRRRRWVAGGSAAVTVLVMGAGVIITRDDGGSGRIRTEDPPATTGITTPPTVDTSPEPSLPSATTAPVMDGERGQVGDECPALPDGITLVVGTDDEVWTLSSTSTQHLGTIDGQAIARAVRGADGTIWAETGTGVQRTIVRITTDGEQTVSEDGHVELSHVGEIGGEVAVTYIDRDEPDVRDSDFWGDVFLERPDGSRESVADARGPETGHSSASPAGEVVALGRWTHNGYTFGYVAADGQPVGGLHEPETPSLEDGPGRSVDSPQPSPDGTRLAWVVGPEWEQEPDEPDGGWVGDWELMVGDPRTGEPSIQVVVGDAAERLIAADYDGRWWVGTFGEISTRGEADDVRHYTPLRVVVVDTAADDAVAVDARCDPGTIVSIDRFPSGDGPGHAPSEPPLVGEPEQTRAYGAITTEGDGVMVGEDGVATVIWDAQDPPDGDPELHSGEAGYQVASVIPLDGTDAALVEACCRSNRSGVFAVDIASSGELEHLVDGRHVARRGDTVATWSDPDGDIEVHVPGGAGPVARIPFDGRSDLIPGDLMWIDDSRLAAIGSEFSSGPELMILDVESESITARTTLPHRLASTFAGVGPEGELLVLIERSTELVAYDADDLSEVMTTIEPPDAAWNVWYAGGVLAWVSTDFVLTIDGEVIDGSYLRVRW